MTTRTTRHGPPHVPVRRDGAPEDHPVAVRVRAAGGAKRTTVTDLEAGWLRGLCLDAGADDVGFAALDSTGLEGEQAYVREVLPDSRSLIVFCVRQSRDNQRSRARSVSNADAGVAVEMANEIGHRISVGLQDHGVRAMYPSATYPVEVQRFPGRTHAVSHKLVAVAAGLGHLGLHDGIIHPRFGTFVTLGTVLTQARIDPYDQPLETNPCIACGLCVEACPVGAVQADGRFDTDSCQTHNQHDFLGGFDQWVLDVADSSDVASYRARRTQSETLMIWQGLSFKPQYKAGYCTAVCPAGDDVIGPYLADPDCHRADIVEPLQAKPEYVYVVQGSDAEAHVRQRFPHKTVRYVRDVVEPPDIDAEPPTHSGERA